MRLRPQQREWGEKPPRPCSEGVPAERPGAPSPSGRSTDQRALPRIVVCGAARSWLARAFKRRSVTVYPVAIATARNAPKIAGGPGSGSPKNRQPTPMRRAMTTPKAIFMANRFGPNRRPHAAFGFFGDPSRTFAASSMPASAREADSRIRAEPGSEDVWRRRRLRLRSACVPRR